MSFSQGVRPQGSSLIRPKGGMPQPAREAAARGTLDRAPSREDQLDHLADVVLGNLDEGRPDVTITNLVHAVHVAYGIGEVPRGLAVKLDRIVARGGGFS